MQCIVSKSVEDCLLKVRDQVDEALVSRRWTIDDRNVIDELLKVMKELTPVIPPLISAQR